MSQNEIGLSRRVMREMVFETVPALLGVGFKVDGLEGFSSALDVVGVAGVDGALVTDPVNLKGMLAKYGFAELHFELAGAPDGLGPADAKTVLELFGASGVDRSESDDVAMRILFLEDLGKEMDQGVVQLVVLARGTPLGGSLAERLAATQEFRELPAGFFPHEFRVDDAYVTNAPSVGLLRHFYL